MESCQRFWRRGAMAVVAGLALAGAAEAQIVINELMYQPAEPWPVWTPAKMTNRTEYVELYNAGTQTVDLAGYRFDNGITYDFPAGSTLGPGSYLVVCEDIGVFTNVYPAVTNVIGNYSGNLDNGGERVTLSRLSDSNTWDTVDTVAYIDYGLSNGDGPSLELVNSAFASLRDQFQGDWLDSTAPSGTPGRVNSVFRANPLPVMGDVLHSPALPPANSVVEIRARVAWPKPQTTGSVRLRYRKDALPQNAWTEAPMNEPAGDGVYTALLPEYGQAPMAAGEMIEFRIVAADADGEVTYPLESRAGVTNGPCSYYVKFGEDSYADCAFPGEYPAYHILTTASNKLWRETTADIRDDTLLDATLITSDGRIYYNCGWRLRGNTTRKKLWGGYRIELPAGRTLDGLRELNLDSSGAAKMFFAMNIFDAVGYGCHGNNLQLARVWVNGELKLPTGSIRDVYYLAERVKSDMMSRYYPDPIGNIYWTDRVERKGQLQYFPVLSNYPAAYFCETNYPPSVWVGLSNLCGILEQPTSQYPAVLPERVNVRQWARFFATYCALDHGETAEWRLYEDPRDGQFDLFAWDVDESFSASGKVWDFPLNSVSGALVKKLIACQPVAPYYAGDVLDVMDTVMARSNMVALLVSGGSKISPSTSIPNTFDTQRANLHAALSNGWTVSVNGVAAQGSAVILPASGGTLPLPVTLSGSAPQAYTARVLVNGTEAAWDLRSNVWVTTNAILLSPGVNPFTLETRDPDNQQRQSIPLIVVVSTNYQSVSGTVSSNTLWTGHSGSLLVEGDIVVDSGATLSITGGAVIVFGAGRKIKMNNGTLNLQGSPSNPVYLYSSNGVAGWAIEASGSGSMITGRYVVAGGGRLAADNGAILDWRDAVLADGLDPAGIVAASNAAGVYLGRCVVSNFVKSTFINSPVMIEDSLFTRMTACGVEVCNSQTSAVIRCTSVVDSVAPGSADGIRITNAPITMASNCLIRGISGSGVAGGGGSARVVGSLVISNGMGVAARAGMALTHVNNTISGCVTGLWGMTSILSNSIVWNNGVNVASNPPTASYSDVELAGTNVYAGIANLNRNPWFRSPADGDYRLLPISPCLHSASDGGAMGASFPAGANPEAPVGLVVTQVTAFSAELRWEDASGDEAGFEVQRSAVGDGWVTITRLAANVTNWVDTGLNQDSDYGYRVRAFHARGQSLFSETILVTTPPDTSTDLLRQYLKITEIMYNPPGSGDVSEFIELRNTGPDPLDLSGLYFDGARFAFTNGTLLGAGAFFVLVYNPAGFVAGYPGVAYQGSYQNGTSLDNGGETIWIRNAQGVDILEVDYDDVAPWPTVADGEGYSLVLVNENDPGPYEAWRWRASTGSGGSPGADDPVAPYGHILINEILAHQDVEFPGDWIELFNAGSNSVDIGGWYLSDKSGNLTRFRIPSNTVLAAGGYQTFTEASDFGTNALGTNGFALSERGESVYLSSASNGTLTSYRVSVEFEATENGVTQGRHLRSDGQVDFTALSAATRATSNAYPKVGPVVINEIMYNPASGGKEFVELLNISGETVPLYDPANRTNTWRFAGAMEFVFPTNVVMAPGEHLLVVSTDPVEFRALFGLTNAALKAFGPFEGALANSGETVKLYKPGEPELDGFVPFILVDRIQYDDTAPWPTAADNGGASLERIDPLSYGNDPANWQAQTLGGTPGLSNNVLLQPTVAFMPPEGSALETNVIVKVAVTLWPPVTNTVTVNYAVTGGTASNGVDYALAAGILVFWPYDTVKTFPLVITNDVLREDDETIQIGLTQVSTNARLGGNRTFTYTIVDTDGTLPAPVISPAGTNGFTHSITVAISNTLPGAVVRYTLDGTQPGEDAPVYQTPLVLTESARVTARTFLGSYLAGKTNASALFLEQAGEPTASALTLAVTAATAVEMGQVPGQFNVSRGTNSSGALTVNYLVGGTAMNSADYTTLSGSVTIPDGQTQAGITVTPVDDHDIENPESVILTLAGNGTNYLIGIPSIGAVTILSDDGATVTLTASDTPAAETNQTPGTVTVSRGTHTVGDLRVEYVVGGTASNAIDYLPLPGIVTIPDGQSDASIMITPVDDTLYEGAETVSVTLLASTNYMTGFPSNATVALMDNEPIPPLRVVWNGTQPNASWSALYWNDGYSETNRVPLRGDDVLLGDVTIDTREAGANIAGAVARSLQIGWRTPTNSGDSGTLLVYGDAGDPSLTVEGTLYVANGQGKNGALLQEGGLISVGGDMKMCYGANFGVASNDINGGSLQIGGHLFLGDLGISGVDFINSSGSTVDFDQAAGSSVSVGGDIRGNRGNSATALNRLYKVNAGASLRVGGSMQFGGCFRMDSAGEVSVAGNVELCKDSSRTTSVINVMGGLFTVGGVLDMNEPGQGQVYLSGGTLRVNHLDLKTATANKLNISGTGVLQVRQSNYPVMNANNDIEAGDITGVTAANVWTVNVSGTHYTQISGIYPVDANGNQIPDVWETAYFGSTTNAEGWAEGDWDQDGLSNYGEWVAGTDPTNFQSVFRSTNVVKSAENGIILRWSSESNRYYTVRLSTNLLTDPFSYVLTHRLPAHPPENVHTDAVTRPGAFYRITVTNQ